MSEWITSSAVFSEDHAHRYVLTRRWGPGSGNWCAFIGLNPSTADENIDDPTVRRCVRYAKRWRYSGLVMLNIHSLRSTDPRALYTAAAPEGDPDNLDRILHWSHLADQVICAWGTHGALRNRGQVVSHALHRDGIGLHCLGLTKEGFPKHPLYLRSDLNPIPYP